MTACPLVSETKHGRLFPIFVRQGRSPQHYKAGYIDRQGNIVVVATYDNAHPFREGLGCVRVKDLFAAVKSDGELAFDPISHGSLTFTEGLSTFSIKSKRGVIDRYGKVVLPPRYRSISHFSGGLACVSNDEHLYGFINREGYQVIPPFFEDARAFSEGLAAVKMNGKWGYISASGSAVIECRFECGRGAAGSFREGLARVAWDGRWGYINPAGEFVIPPRFDMASEFSEGLGGVEIEKRRGFVNASGEMVVPICYRWADPFSEGLAAVSIGTGEAHKSVAEACETGFIDRSGTFRIPARFLSAGRFVGGLCLVEDEHCTGYIDHSGEFVWRAPYVEIGSLDPLHLLPPERD